MSLKKVQKRLSEKFNILAELASIEEQKVYYRGNVEMQDVIHISLPVADEERLAEEKVYITDFQSDLAQFSRLLVSVSSQEEVIRRESSQALAEPKEAEMVERENTQELDIAS